MKIGIDFGGVIEFDEYGYGHIIIDLSVIGHEVYILSHAHKGDDHKRRSDFALTYGAIDLTFSEINPNDEAAIQKRKSELVKQYNLDIFIDDYMNRCIAVQKDNPNCICIYAAVSKWQMVRDILKGITKI